MSKEQEFHIQHPTEKWKLDSRPSVEIMENLSEALKSKNFNQIKELLKNPQIARRILLDRREGSKNLVTLQDSFDLMFQERFGPKADIFTEESEKILDWVHDIEWPEYILTNMLDSAYHLKDFRRFFRILTIISENENRLKDKEVLLIAQHDLATWESTASGNPSGALKINKDILGQAIKLNDKTLETKIRYGVAHNKPLKPKEKAGDFEKLAASFDESGDEYDAIRAMAEAAKAYLALAKGQWGDSKKNKFDNLEKAQTIAEESLDRAEKLKYSNGMYHAHLALAGIYAEKKDKLQANDHQREVERLKKLIGYQY
jgi:hypothetical protein